MKNTVYTAYTLRKSSRTTEDRLDRAIMWDLDARKKRAFADLLCGRTVRDESVVSIDGPLCRLYASRGDLGDLCPDFREALRCAQAVLGANWRKIFARKVYYSRSCGKKYACGDTRDGTAVRTAIKAVGCHLVFEVRDGKPESRHVVLYDVIPEGQPLPPLTVVA